MGLKTLGLMGLGCEFRASRMGDSGKRPPNDCTSASQDFEAGLTFHFSFSAMRRPQRNTLIPGHQVQLRNEKHEVDRSVFDQIWLVA